MPRHPHCSTRRLACRQGKTHPQRIALGGFQGFRCYFFGKALQVATSRCVRSHELAKALETSTSSCREEGFWEVLSCRTVNRTLRSRRCYAKQGACACVGGQGSSARFRFSGHGPRRVIVVAPAPRRGSAAPHNVTVEHSTMVQCLWERANAYASRPRSTGWRFPQWVRAPATCHPP